MSFSPPSRRQPRVSSSGTSPPMSQPPQSVPVDTEMEQPESQAHVAPPSATESPTRKSLKRKQVEPINTTDPTLSASGSGDPGGTGESVDTTAELGEPFPSPTAAKKSRTNTPWTPAEERRLKSMRDAGNSWSEIAKTFPARTEGSVKKHWYKDMHYADFAEDESAALLAAIKEYEASKWKVIGQKVGKPAKACEQYAKEHFGGKI